MTEEDWFSMKEGDNRRTLNDFSQSIPVMKWLLAWTVTFGDVWRVGGTAQFNISVTGSASTFVSCKAGKAGVNGDQGKTRSSRYLERVEELEEGAIEDVEMQIRR